jgi:glutamate N-acetyltransferase/amino-acid N-acetyltransferase
MAKALPSSSPSRSKAARIAECRQVGYAIGHSPLVKTAFFASDPNLGRILAAVGYAGINDLDVDGVASGLMMCWWPKTVAGRGRLQGRGWCARHGQAEITVRVDLGRGHGKGKCLYLRFFI